MINMNATLIRLISLIIALPKTATYEGQGLGLSDSVGKQMITEFISLTY